MAEIDLEALAAGYDHPPPTPSTRDRAGSAAGTAGLGEGSVAVDVGGGRGWHAAEFAARGAMALVVDRSEVMVAAAARRPGVEAVVGDGLRLPVGDGRAALVYFHLSIHYLEWRRALDEAWRACRPGGVVWVWTFLPEHHRRSFLARWFPSVAGIDESRFPAPDLLATHLNGLGGDPRTAEAPEHIERRAGDWRAGVAGGFVSTLQMLPAGELEDGLRRFDASHPDPGEIVEYDLLWCAVWVRRPSLR